MTYVISILITAILFLGLVLLLSVKPSISKKITVGALAFSGISGFFIYGYGYAVITDNLILASLKALLAVCSSFVGGNEFSSIASVPIMQTVWMRIFFEFIRLAALYATASAIITTIGRETLKKLRLILVRRGRINVIYGINDDTLALGRDLAQKKKGIIVFVAEKATSVETIATIGGVIKTDVHALSADRKFLRSIGFSAKRRTLTLYAVSKNSIDNIKYAKKLLNSLELIKTPSEVLRLVILEQEESAVSRLQCTSEKYGYGFVNAINEPQMAARLLMMKYPPCDYVSFDSDCKATENFDALVIGFGQVGQAVLKNIVMNAQFEGSDFHLSVFAKDYNSTDGRFADQLSSLCSNYDLSFYGYDARSREMYDYHAKHRDTLKYVVVCVGNTELNHEIATDLMDYFRRYNREVPVFICSRNGVEAYSLDSSETVTYNIYRADLIDGEQLDNMAMIVNHSYQSGSDNTPLQNWMECDYFSRQSCRAFADFVPAVLRAANKTEAQVCSGDWALTDTQKENLSKTEHLRWCAFHYCMGFSPMTDEEFILRSNIYKEQIAVYGTSNLRIAKNMKDRTHACLVSWNDLEVLSAKEAAVTGKFRDYQAMDTNNILSLPELLRASKQ
ncbi:MAG: hypothetical protein IJD37_07470 [Clostridia bacterium]|nr:hypothetical protein [Clostridia bacterium]